MMSEDTKSQRGGTGLAFRLILSAFAALFGFTMLLIAPGAEKPVGHYLFGCFCLAIAAVCFTRGRVQAFIGGIIASAVLATTVWYLVSEFTGGPIFSGSRSIPSVMNAVLAMLVFGLPAAAYLRKARFGFGSQPGTEPGTETIQIDDGGSCGSRVQSENRFGGTMWKRSESSQQTLGPFPRTYSSRSWMGRRKVVWSPMMPRCDSSFLNSCSRASLGSTTTPSSRRWGRRVMATF